jgi:hypothetical protein
MDFDLGRSSFLESTFNDNTIDKITVIPTTPQVFSQENYWTLEQILFSFIHHHHHSSFIIHHHHHSPTCNLAAYSIRIVHILHHSVRIVESRIRITANKPIFSDIAKSHLILYNPYSYCPIMVLVQYSKMAFAACYFLAGLSNRGQIDFNSHLRDHVSLTEAQALKLLAKKKSQKKSQKKSHTGRPAGRNLKGNENHEEKEEIHEEKKGPGVHTLLIQLVGEDEDDR